MFENYRISFKLIFIFSIPLAMLMAIVGGVYWITTDVQEKVHLAESAATMQLNTSQIWQYYTDICLTGDKSPMEKIKVEKKSFEDNWGKFDAIKHTLHKEDADRLAIMKQDFDKFNSFGDQMIEAYTKSKEDGNKVMDSFDKAGLAMVESLKPFAEDQELALEAALSQLMYGVIIAGLIALLVGGFICWRTSLSILNPINLLMGAFRRVSEGDLRTQVNFESKDEIGELSRDFNIMVQGFQAVVRQIGISSKMVEEAAQELTNTSHRNAESVEQEVSALNDLSSQTNEISSQVMEVSSQLTEMSSSIEQASATTESQFEFVNRTSSTIEEMSASALAVSERAAHARQLSMDSVHHADEGSSAVNKAIDGMTHISQTIREMSEVIEKLGRRSDQIGEILSTINSIAAQTNLLALNAAIEAARAGEHGRGFAVVADEVRKLAEGTANATDEIAEIIKGIQTESKDAIQATKRGISKVSEGTELTQSVGKALTSLISSINTTSQAVEEIAASAEEQAKAAMEATHSVQELKTMSEQISIGIKEEARGTSEISNAMNESSKAVQSAASALQQIKSAVDISSANIMQLATAAETLMGQSEELTKAINRFVIEARDSDNTSNQQNGTKSMGMKTFDQNDSTHSSNAQNCWEYKKCGREAGGKNVSQMGVCPAYPDKGKSCATVSGTFCGGQVQGAFASKIKSCSQCDFYTSNNYGKQ